MHCRHSTILNGILRGQHKLARMLTIPLILTCAMCSKPSVACFEVGLQFSIDYYTQRFDVVDEPNANTPYDFQILTHTAMQLSRDLVSRSINTGTKFQNQTATAQATGSQNVLNLT